MSDKKDNDLPLGELAEQVESLEAQTLELQDQLGQSEEAKIRALADLQNFQRRQAEDRMKWSSLAVTEFLKKALPSFLELQLGAEHSEDESVKSVIAKFFQNLESQGLSQISPEPGVTIDPEQHEVLMAAEGKPGTVVQCLEAGWMYQEGVIIPAKVSGATQ